MLLHAWVSVKRLWNMALTFKQTKIHKCMHAPVHMEWHGHMQNKAQRNAPSILHATHSHRWSAQHIGLGLHACVWVCVRACDVCVADCALVGWSGLMGKGGSLDLETGRVRLGRGPALGQAEDGVVSNAHTHTHTHKCAPPAAFSWPASPVPHRNICFKIYVSSFNESVGGVSPAAIVSHYVKWKHLAKTHENVCKCTVLHAQVRHSNRNQTVTQLLTGNNAQQMKCGFTTRLFCNVTHFRNKLWILKKIKWVNPYVLETYISENNILNQSKLLSWTLLYCELGCKLWILKKIKCRMGWSWCWFSSESSG